jgi:hypothetical protein
LGPSDCDRASGSAGWCGGSSCGVRVESGVRRAQVRVLVHVRRQVRESAGVCLRAQGSRRDGAAWAVAVFWLEIVCDCGWSQDLGARRRSQCGPREVERG